MIKKRLLTLIVLMATIFCFAIVINAECAHQEKWYADVFNPYTHEVHCKVCAELLPNESHTFVYKSSNLEFHSYSCKDCLHTRTTPHSAPSTWNLINMEGHYKKCATCSYTFSGGSHVIDIVNSRCTVCGYTGPFAGISSVEITKN